MLFRYYRWYDDLPEPKRFGMAVAMISPVFVLAHVTDLWVGLTCVALLMTLIFTRVRYLLG